MGHRPWGRSAATAGIVVFVRRPRTAPLRPYSRIKRSTVQRHGDSFPPKPARDLAYAVDAIVRLPHTLDLGAQVLVTTRTSRLQGTIVLTWIGRRSYWQDIAARINTVVLTVIL